jgi:hypothetical protein
VLQEDKALKVVKVFQDQQGLKEVQVLKEVLDQQVLKGHQVK